MDEIINNTELSISAALAAAVGDVETVVCDSYNSQHNYWYTSDAALFEQARPLMAKYGLALIFRGFEHEMVDGGQSSRGRSRNFVNLVTSWSLIHTESGEELRINMLGVAEDNGGKGFASAMTSARKLVVQTLFCLASRDPDTPPPGAKPQKPQPKERQQPSERPERVDPAKVFEGWLDRLARRSLESDTEKGTDYQEFLAASVIASAEELGHEHEEVREAIFFVAQQIQEGVFTAAEIAAADELACLRGTEVWPKYAAVYESEKAAEGDQGEATELEEEPPQPEEEPPSGIDYDDDYEPEGESYGA